MLKMEKCIYKKKQNFVVVRRCLLLNNIIFYKIYQREEKESYGISNNFVFDLFRTIKEV